MLGQSFALLHGTLSSALWALSSPSAWCCMSQHHWRLLGYHGGFYLKPQLGFFNRDFTQFWRNGAPFKCIVTIVTMKSQSPEQCKVEVQIVRICGSNLEPRDFSAKILAVKCSNFTLDLGSVRFQYTSVTFSNLILAPAGAQEVALSVCESVCPCAQFPCCLLGVSQSQGPLKGLSGVSQSSLRGISAFSNAFLVIVSEHKILHLVLLV